MSTMKRTSAIAALALAIASCASASDFFCDFSGGGEALGFETPVVRRESLPAVSLPGVAVGDRLSVRFSQDASYEIRLEGMLPSFGGSKSFSGRDVGGLAFATAVESPGGLLVEVRDFSAGRLHRAVLRADSTVVEEVDLTALRGGGCIEVDVPGQEAGDEGAAAGTGSRKTDALLAVAGNPFDGNVVAPAPVTVDIMIVFDDGARAWTAANAAYGGSITNFAIAQVAKMNDVLRNTGLHTNFWFRLVDVAAVDGRWTKIDDTILPAMRAGVMGASGVWDGIASRRKACGADLVSLMVDTGSAYGITGIGYITHGTSYATWVNTYSTWCYSCCAIRSVDLEYTLCHEVGHNMGLAHSPTLATWSKPGTFEYSNGYNFTAAEDGRHYNTIMAYNYDRYFSDYVEIPYYSSPDYFFKGSPVGTAVSNDCTSALRQTCVGIADWHARTVPLPSDVVFSPNASSAYRISLSTLGGYEIRYTTDGSEPTRESALYAKPLLLTSGEMTVKAVAVVDAETLGAVATGTYAAAVELGEYVWLEDTSEKNWSQGYWDRDDGSPVFPYFWNNSSNKTAVVDVDGAIDVDRDISLATLVVGGQSGLEMSVSGHSLFATNLEVVGAATLSGTAYSFGRWWLHPESTLVLAPGEGQTVTLPSNLALSYPSATFAVSNGTVVAGAGGSAAGQFGSAALHVHSGGTLRIAGGGWNTGSATEASLTVDRGGTLEIAAVDDIHRSLVLDGGTLSITKSGRAASFYDLKMRVTDDSTVTDNGGTGEIWIRTADVGIDVADGKTLTFGAAIARPSDDGYQSLGKGLVKTGKGEARFLREISHSGTNTISGGTLAVGYSSSADNALAWVVSDGAALKVERGCSLRARSLSLSHGSSLVIPAAATAPLSVAGAIDVTHVSLTLTGADDLSHGAAYPLVSATGGIAGVSRIRKDSLPALANGLVWRVSAADGTLSATVATPEEASDAVPLVSNDEGFVVDIPDDAVRLGDGGVALAATPLTICDLDTKAIALTLDVEIPEAEQAERKAICSWKIGQNVVYCVREADGTLDCYYVGETAHVDNATNKVALASGRHTICVGYYSSAWDGTWVYVDGKAAYYAKGLKWQEDNVSAVAVGGIVGSADGSYEGLVVRQIALVDAASGAPLATMTDSGGDAVSYSYVASRASRVFATHPAGGFMMEGAVLAAEFANMHDAASVSVVASFPTNAVGSVMSFWVQLNDSSKAACQAEYEGDGTFAIRYDGNSLGTLPSTAVSAADPSVDSPHLYTMTFLSGYGVTLYQDGVEIARSEAPYNYSRYAGNRLRSPVNFGCGAWHAWRGSFVANPNPMPGFRAYASHVAFGTDDVLASVDPVIETLNFDEAYDGLPLAEKLSYLPECQTATGVRPFAKPRPRGGVLVVW